MRIQRYDYFISRSKKGPNSWPTVPPSQEITINTHARLRRTIIPILLCICVVVESTKKHESTPKFVSVFSPEKLLLFIYIRHS